MPDLEAGVACRARMSEPTPSSAPGPLFAGESIDSAILRLLMENLPDRVYFKDAQSRFVRVNRAHARWLGLRNPEEAIGRTDADFFSAEHAHNALANEEEIMRTGVPMEGKTERIVKQDGSSAWGSSTKLPWRDAAGRVIGTFGVTRDVTAAKEAETKLYEERKLLRTIIDHLPSRIFVKDLEARYVINNVAHLESFGLKSQEQLAGHTLLEFFPGKRGHQSLADDHQVLSGGPSLISQEKSDFGPEGHVRWSLTTKVPLRDLHGAIVGLVGISHDITERKRVEQELERRTHEMETDVKMARQIQEVFLPRTFPVFPRGVPAESSALRFAHRYLPAATLGGDFFDILQLNDTQCGVLLCDIMGHGVRAGLLTALIRGLVEELGDRAANPSFVLGEINHGLAPILQQTGQPVFATVFYAVVDTQQERLWYSNAGHPAPLIVHTLRGTVEPLTMEDPEPAAGILEGFAYSSHHCDFQAGDLLFGFTDGLFEAADASGAIFGLERLRGVVTQQSSLPGGLLIDRTIAAVQAFSGRSEFEDDICVLAVESTGTTCAMQPLTYEI